MMDTVSASDEVLAKILAILKRGNTVEIKRVGGEIQIIEIQRKIKERMTITTG